MLSEKKDSNVFVVNKIEIVKDYESFYSGFAFKTENEICKDMEEVEDYFDYVDVQIENERDGVKYTVITFNCEKIFGNIEYKIISPSKKLIKKIIKILKKKNYNEFNNDYESD